MNNTRAREFFGLMYDSYMNLSKEKELKSFYAVEFNDGLVKIGVSKSPNERISIIQKQSGRFANDIFISTPMEAADAFRIENALKKKYQKYKANGEFFNISLQEVISSFLSMTNRKGETLCLHQSYTTGNVC